MKRRNAITLTAISMGGTIIGAETFLSGCTTGSKKDLPSATEDIAFLDAIGETILPQTAESPGAKEARIGEFMLTIVNDCYNQQEQKIFFEGMKKLNEAALKQFSNNFMALSAIEKHQLLTNIDGESRNPDENKKDHPVHYFRMMKQLIVWGYFTSEPGCTKALRYNPVPGRYEGCIPYVKGDRAWA